MRIGRGAIGWIGLLAVVAVTAVVWIARDHRTVPTHGPVASRDVETPPQEPLPSTPVRAAASAARVPASTAAFVQAIEVHVVDRGSRAIAGARIKVRDGEETRSFYSDSSGRCRFSLEKTPGEFVRMQADADGYCPSLPAFRNEPIIEIVLSRAVVLHGRVLDESTREPIAGTSVQRGVAFLAEEPEFTVETGPDGAFEMPDVPAGGGVQIVVRVKSGPIDSKIVTIDERDEKPTYDFLLARGKRIRGRVLDWTSGEPMPEAVVVDAKRHQDVALVGADGGFEVRLLPPTSNDRPVLGIRAPGHCRMSRSIDRDEDEPVDLGEVRLPQSIALEGTVRDAAGAPIAGVDLQAGVDLRALFEATEDTKKAFDESTRSLGRWMFDDFYDVYGGRVRTDSEGAFRVESLSQWMQLYWVRSLPNERHSIEVRGEGHESPGGTIHVDIVVQPPKGTRLAGRLLLNGKPIAGKVTWDNGERGDDVRVGGDGRFVVDPIGEGRVRLRTERGVSVGSSLLSKEYTIDMKPGDVIERDFDLVASVARSSGRVISTRGEALAGVHLDFSSARAGFEAGLRTDREGRWSLDLPTDGGTCRVDISYAGEERVENVEPGTKDLEWKLPATVLVRVRAVDKATRALVPLPEISWRKAGDDRFSSPEGTYDGSGWFPSTDGWYSFRVPEGSIDFQVAAAAQGFPRMVQLGVPLSQDDKEPRIEFELERGLTIGFHLTSDPPRIPGGSLWCFLVTQEELDAAKVRAVDYQGSPRDLIPEDIFPAIKPFHIPTGKTVWISAVQPGRYRLISTGPFYVDTPESIDVAADRTDVEVRWKRDR